MGEEGRMSQVEALADKLAEMVMRQRTVPVASCRTHVWAAGETVALRIVTRQGEHIDVSFRVGMEADDV